MEWEQQKWGVSWVLNDTQHRPPGPWREWKKKKVSTALVRTGEGGRDGGAADVWAAAEVVAAEKEMEALMEFLKDEGPAYQLAIARAEVALFNAACKTASPLAFKAHKFSPAHRQFSLGHQEAAALRLKGAAMARRTKEKGRPAWCWSFDDPHQAGNWLRQGPLGATWTADAGVYKIFTHVEITKETPLRCVPHVYCCSCHTCCTCIATHASNCVCGAAFSTSLRLLRRSRRRR